MVGCGGAAKAPPAPPPPAPPVPVASIHGCTDAAAGLVRATKDLRHPDEATSSREALEQRCNADAWPQDAVDCFATLKDGGEITTCAKLLVGDASSALLGVVAGAQQTDMGELQLKLSQLKVGVAACDRFVAAVSTILSCEQMPLSDRLTLGNETAEFWSLPTHGLSTDVAQRMTQACGESLQALQQHAVDVGCML